MNFRQRVFIDREVQGALIGRVVVYWAIAVGYVGISTACYQYCEHPNWSLMQHGKELVNDILPWLPGILITLPLVLFDIARLSNRFVGPIYRLRKHLEQLTKDHYCKPLKFRSDDYWNELSTSINELQGSIIAAILSKSRAENATREIQWAKVAETLAGAALPAAEARLPAKSVDTTAYPEVGLGVANAPVKDRDESLKKLDEAEESAGTGSVLRTQSGTILEPETVAG